MAKIITEKNLEILLKRMKSLTWRTGMMILGLFIAFAIESLTLLDVPTEVKIILGLVLGEISKQLNSSAK